MPFMRVPGRNGIGSCTEMEQLTIGIQTVARQIFKNR